MKKLLIIGLVGVLVVSWCFTPIEAKSKEEVYQEKSARINQVYAKEYLSLARWCKMYRLFDRAEKNFKLVLEYDPENKPAQKQLEKGFPENARPPRNIERLLDQYDRKLLARYKKLADKHCALGVWCKKNNLPDEAGKKFDHAIELCFDHQKARKELGYVKLKEFGWGWMDKETAAKRLAAIKKLGVYKGVLDKPWVDKENLPWENAREKETDHFMVKTNLSIDALNDICFLMECIYFTYQDIFEFDSPKEKLRVMVSKNHDEYKKIYYDLKGNGTNPPGGGCFMPASTNKPRQDHLLGYYHLSWRPPLTAALLHECAHYAMELVKQKYGCSTPPTWLDEGWASYYEASRLEGIKLVTNVINQVWLPDIKDAINKQTCIKLKDFINLARKEYIASLQYAQGWSLIYFLLNGQGGKHKTGLQAYMETWKKNKITVHVVKDKSAHIKLFEECMGVPMDQLEEEWKEYILKLK